MTDPFFRALPSPGCLLPPTRPATFTGMSTTEILEELPRLDREEREKVWRRLEEIELEECGETPEMLAAIDAGRRSIRKGRSTTVEEARGLIAQWITKSS